MFIGLSSAYNIILTNKILCYHHIFVWRLLTKFCFSMMRLTLKSCICDALHCTMHFFESLYKTLSTIPSHGGKVTSWNYVWWMWDKLKYSKVEISRNMIHVFFKLVLGPNKETKLKFRFSSVNCKCWHFMILAACICTYICIDPSYM